MTYATLDPKGNSFCTGCLQPVPPEEVDEFLRRGHLCEGCGPEDGNGLSEWDDDVVGVPA